MSSAALAGELGLPLFNIQLDGLITKFMGETSSKLRLIFDAVRTTRGVYFFDEFDAIGSARNLKNDVGEIRRVLNSFLQFLELDESNSLVVAATNHMELLDKALFRRFDAVIKYVLPSPAIAGEVMKSRLAILDSARVDWEAVIRASEGLSHAEIAAASDQAAKNAILEQTSTVSSAALALALKERRDHE
jgi:SpoVK/Ycf46/Vps4 family AAA+-type ATPase